MLSARDALAVTAVVVAGVFVGTWTILGFVEVVRWLVS